MSRVEVTRISAYGLVCDVDRILLCRFSEGIFSAGMWTLPGGGIEFGEYPEEAMVREVEEETGLRVMPMGFAGISSFRHDTDVRAFHGIRVIYHATLLGGELRHEVAGSTDRCEWHRLDSLDRIDVVELVDFVLPLLPLLRQR